MSTHLYTWAFPGGEVGKNPSANAKDARDTGLIPGLEKMLWSRKWQPAPIFLSGKFHGQRILAGFRGFPVSLAGKESSCNAGDPGSIPRLGEAPGDGNGYPLQYSVLENSMESGAWWATVHRVARVRQN